MIDVMKIMETNTPEQREEMHKEAMRILEEKHVAFMKNHNAFMENHDARMTELRIHIQEVRARTPKRQIYFGKVKTE
jgi:trimethylamine:corrinoid methyltransferase-like protein